MTQVSLIVPVYNTENYLGECLESLVNQSLEGIEIIIINDGSTDGSKAIIETYKSKYFEKVQVIEQENMGIGASRNKGIRMARGEYIAFVDSDDILHKDFCKIMYEYIHCRQLDVVVCDFYEFIDNSLDRRIKKIAPFKNSTVYQNPSLLFNINTSPWNKIYNLNFLKENKIDFPERLKYEDVVFAQNVLAKGAKIGQVKQALIYYRTRSGSESTVVKKDVFDILLVLDIVNRNYRNSNQYEIVLDYLEYFNINRITVYNLQQVYQKDKEYINDFIESGYKYLNENFRSWKNNSLFVKNNTKLEMRVKRNKRLTKLYVKIMRKLKNRR